MSVPLHKPMTSFYKTRGLVLRRWAVSESDRMVRLFSPERGKLDLLVQGGSKIASKLAPHLEPYSETEIMVVLGRRSEKIAAANLQRRFVSFVTSVLKKAIADAIIEVTDTALISRQAEPKLAALMMSAWERLDSLKIEKVNQRTEASLLLCAYALRVLDTMGYRPNLRSCVACNTPLRRRGNRLVIGRGGVLCASCTALEKNVPGNPVSDVALALLRFVATKPYTTIRRVQAQAIHERQLLHTVREFVEYYLEREMRSWRYYESLAWRKRSGK